MNSKILHEIYLKAGAELAEQFPGSTLVERHEAGLAAVAEFAAAKLTFSEFDAISHARALRWHVNGGLEEWNEAEWTNALAGEAGEACNAAKKLRRIVCGIRQRGGDSGVPANLEEARRKMAKELGDAQAYLSLAAQRIGWTTEQCARLAFNQISEREGFPERI